MDMNQAILRTMKYDTFYGSDPNLKGTIVSFDYRKSGEFRTLFALNSAFNALIGDVQAGKRVLVADISPIEGELLATYAKGLYPGLSTIDRYESIFPDKRHALRERYEAHPGMTIYPSPFKESQQPIDS